MPETVEINGKTYTVLLTNNEAGNEPHLQLKCGDEVLQLSPNTTPEELEAYANASEKGHDLNG